MLKNSSKDGNDVFAFGPKDEGSYVAVLKFNCNNWEPALKLLSIEGDNLGCHTTENKQDGRIFKLFYNSALQKPYPIVMVAKVIRQGDDDIIVDVTEEDFDFVSFARENLIVPDVINDPQTITFKLNPSWNKKDAGILTQLGYAFEVGSIFEQDYATAAKLYYIAATVGGDSQAMNNYGWLCLNGWGMKKDVQTAKIYFDRAAETGNTMAMINLGNIYEFGELGEPDYAQSFEWYKKAADAGDMKGMFNYANCYHHGWGTRGNYKKAFSIFKKLADAGYEDAFFYVGLYYQEGKGTDKDYKMAEIYYELGANMGDKLCYNQLGVMYAKGLGVKKDAKAALDYYMQAGDMGDALAYTNVAALYENGELGTPDLETAKKYYRIAAKQDEPYAIEALQRLGEEIEEKR